MPSIIIRRAPGIAFAVARPPDGLTSGSRVPWMTALGTWTWCRASVRSPEAMIACSWRATPAAQWPRS